MSNSWSELFFKLLIKPYEVVSINLEIGFARGNLPKVIQLGRNGDGIQIHVPLIMSPDSLAFECLLEWSHMWTFDVSNVYLMLLYLLIFPVTLKDMFTNHLRAYLWTHLKNIDLDLCKEVIVKNIDFQIVNIYFLCF